MNKTTSISTLTEADFSGISVIANKQFGNDYLSNHELQSYIVESSKIGLVARTNDVVTGFSLVQICDSGELMNLVLHIFIISSFLLREEL
jgi:hypothetical protein